MSGKKPAWVRSGKRQTVAGAEQSKIIMVCHNRLVVVAIVFLLVFLTISVRLFALGLMGNGAEVSVAENRSTPELFYSRAKIVDRNGVLLAVNLETASLYANPRKVLDANEAIKKLTMVFHDLNKKELRKRLTSRRHFVWIRRNLTPQEESDVNSLGIPGLYFTNEEKRVYPHGNLFAHVLGYSGLDGKGLAGIENHFDSYLRNVNDANPDMKPLQLSVDVRVQNVLRSSLEAGMERYHAEGAAGVIADVNTGEILALSSLPDFDPNLPARATRNEKFNRATLGVYEMGSTFKTFTMALGLESGVVSMRDSYDVSEPIRLDGFTINDYHRHNGRYTIPEIFIHSSNIGSGHIVLDVGESRQRAFLSSLGLLDPLSLEVPETGSPLYPERWGKVNAITISYGHGIAVTPVHVVRAVSSLINGGILYPETLVKHKKGATIEGVRVISAKTSEKMRQLMRFAVKYGTGEKANEAGYMVGGKTGTADKAFDGSYGKAGIMSSFVAAFPMNAPRYVMLVMYDNPRHQFTDVSLTGGMSAAPTVGSIITRIAPILDISPVNEDSPKLAREFKFDYTTPDDNKDTTAF